MSAPRIAEAASDAELAACFPVMRQLRPHLTDAAEFIRRVRRQAAEGFRVLALWQGDTVVACAGYRLTENLHRGRHMYVDDLVTRSDDRSKGFGKLLFDWLVAQARAHGCAVFSLDSGVQRFDAHRFYLVNRMKIDSHHFALRLS